MKPFLLVVVSLLLVACTVTRQPGAAERESPLIAPEEIAVCRMVSPQIAGSLTPLGGKRALTAGHVYRQPVTDLNGKRTGLTRLTADFTQDVSATDWVQLEVNDLELPKANHLEVGHRFMPDDVIYIAGYVNHPSSAVRTTAAGHSYVQAKVIPPPSWAQNSSGLVFVDVPKSPDLSGASGGPVLVWDSETHWTVVGIYLGTWRYGFSKVYVIRVLPDECGTSSKPER